VSLRRLDVAGADLLRAAVPLAVLLLASLVPWVAGACLAALVLGVVVAAGRRAPVVWAWAAGVPAAALLTMRAFGGYMTAWGAAGCVGAGPVVAWAVGEALLVAGLTAALVLALGATTADVGLRRPPRYARRWAAGGSAVLLGIGLTGVVLLSGPVLERPLDLGGVAFVLPAVGWAIAVAVSEELAWRGALQGWLTRTAGPGPALLVQAAVYGIAWGVFAPDVLPMLVAGVLAGVAGLLLGALAVRTRSIWTGLAWHAAFNVPLFVALACAS
jgi:membrane protease YdiL (CAAX protease family)